MSPKKSSMLLPVFYWSLIFMIMTLQCRRIYSKVYFLLLTHDNLVLLLLRPSIICRKQKLFRYI